MKWATPRRIWNEDVTELMKNRGLCQDDVENPETRIFGPRSTEREENTKNKIKYMYYYAKETHPLNFCM
jgi:hypothetical protein